MLFRDAELGRALKSFGIVSFAFGPGENISFLRDPAEDLRGRKKDVKRTHKLD